MPDKDLLTEAKNIFDQASVSIEHYSGLLGQVQQLIVDNFGETGLYAATEQQWHDCLSRLVEDDTLRERLGRAGRESVMRRYSLATASRLLADLLAELTGGDLR